MLPVLSTLSYFEIFKFPLTAREVFYFINAPGFAENDVIVWLKKGVTTGIIFQFGDYYQTVNAPEWLETRQLLHARADKYLPKAYRMGKLIGRFPFIRGVMVSGSLSKHAMHEDGDIDFFLITSPGRLWFARTLLVLFKKIFLFNSRKYFCVNYFIDTVHLEIEEKNLFTATECATLLPVFGNQWYEAFTAANPWVRDGYLPHFQSKNNVAIPGATIGWFKKGFEKCFSGSAGDLLDRWAMHVTLSFWRRKFKHFDQSQFDLALKSRKYVSKHHPLSFQEKVLNKHQSLMAERSRKLAGDV